MLFYLRLYFGRLARTVYGQWKLLNPTRYMTTSVRNLHVTPGANPSTLAGRRCGHNHAESGFWGFIRGKKLFL